MKQNRSKISVVWGATGGIGSLCVQLLSDRGWTPVIHYYNNQSKALELQNRLKQKGIDTMIVRADIQNENEVRNAIQEIYHRYKRLDASINCAGITIDHLLLMTSIDIWNIIWQTNATGAFITSRETISKMIRQSEGGTVILISSGIGETGRVGQAAYAASKAAVIALTKSVIEEYKSRNITVKCVIFGAVNGGMSTPYLNELSDGKLSLHYVAHKIVDLVEDNNSGIYYLKPENDYEEACK